MTPTLLSVVIPTFNDRARTVKNVHLLKVFLSRWGEAHEIVLVDDGSSEGDVVDPAELPMGTKLVRLAENCGKGAAIRAGMAEARGACRVFTDADLPFDLEALPRIHELVVHKGFNIVVGDRTLTAAGARSYRSAMRRLSSRAFSLFISLFVIGGSFDFQCGLKGFSGPLADRLFPLMRTRRFAFDVEIYYLLLKANIVIKKIPVRLKDNPESTVSPLRDGLQMVVEVCRLVRAYYHGQYDVSQIRDLENENYWKA